MELVYLWVEDYKNIQKQGFNFSPRFECKFHDKYDDNGKLEDNCKLEIIEKKEDEYIKDFFGKNINVTAIVGKNGSGKSSICNILNDLDNKYISYEYIFIGEVDKKLKCFTNIEIENKILNFVDLTYIEKLSYSAKNHYGFTHDKCRFYKQFTFLFLDYKKIYIRNNDKLTRDIKKERIYDLSIREVILDDNFELTTFMSTPKTVTISIDKEFLDDVAIRLNQCERDEQSFYDVFGSKKDVTLVELELFYELTMSTGLSIKDIVNEINSEKNEFELKSRLLDTFLKTTYVHIDNSSLSGHEVSLKNEREIKLDIEEIDSDTLNTTLPYFKFDFEDNQGRKFSDLSHGEQSIYSQFIYIYKYRDKKTLYVLDEPELSLHPEWQRNFIYEFINTFSSLQNNIHLVVTSHSPFLLSDIPKQNIIFLDKEENGDCKVLSHNEVLEKEQTFGANIHTLLSDSFFMENGLIGEFAKTKINEIKKLYQLTQNKNIQKRLKNQKTKELAQKAFNRRKKRLWQIQKIIGEPFLQRVIKNYLDELELLFSDDKTLIAKELAEIEERKKHLEALQKRKG